jgi:hypothetical protein
MALARSIGIGLGKGVDLPGMAGYQLQAATNEASVTIAVLRGGDSVFSLAVAADTDRRLWREFVKRSIYGVPRSISVEREPRAPWLAVSLEEALLEGPSEDMERLEDLEPCLAWGWIDLVALARKRRRRGG